MLLICIVFDANGRLSSHLLETASESPRSRRQMFCSAPVMNCSCVNFIPSRKSVLRTNRQKPTGWGTALFTCISGTLVNGASDPSRLYCVCLWTWCPRVALLYLAVWGPQGRGQSLCSRGPKAGGGKSYNRVLATIFTTLIQRKQSRSFPSDRVWGACLEEVPLELLKSR